MAESNIVIPEAFKLSQERVNDLVNTLGATLVKEFPDNFDLAPVKIGDKIIGRLTAEEAQLYVQFVNATKELEALDSEARAMAFEKLAKYIREGREKEAYGMTPNGPGVTLPDEWIVKIIRARAITDLLGGLFFVSVKERLKSDEAWSNRITIRENYAVVVESKK